MRNTGFKQLLLDESGAVTVDWVVLTAGLVVFGILIASVVAQGATERSTGLGARLSAAEGSVIDFD